MYVSSCFLILFFDIYKSTHPSITVTTLSSGILTTTISSYVTLTSQILKTSVTTDVSFTPSTTTKITSKILSMTPTLPETTSDFTQTISSSAAILCDGSIDTKYECYQCFDGVSGKYLWRSPCKAKKLFSTTTANGKCGFEYACVTTDVGECPYNQYCPESAKGNLSQNTYI